MSDAKRPAADGAASLMNADAIVGIVARVRELAAERGLNGFTIRAETDGTMTFARAGIAVHLFESGRELHVRGPDSGPALQIDPDAVSTGSLGSDQAEGGAREIVRMLYDASPKGGMQTEGAGR